MKCIECNFENNCINPENELCPECNKNFDKCNTCQFPCRSEEERNRIINKVLRQ